MPRPTRCVNLATALLLIAGAAAAAPPPTTITSVARSGNAIPGVGTISSALFFGSGQGPGFLKTAVNNSGAWLLDVHVVQTDTNFDNALLRSSLGLTPYIAEGIPGYLALPTTDHVASNFHSVSLNNAGAVGMATGLFPDDFAFDEPTSGVYFNTTALPAFEGTTISAVGLAAGTIWNRFDASTRVQLNDNNQLLVVSTITESGVSKRAVILLQLSGAGAVTSTTLIAKEGGPVGAGPDTWTSIAPGGHASAVNNNGRVAFSGTTALGVEGVYASGVGFVATRGGPSPTPGLNWGALYGASLDINNNGVVAFRGRLADSDGTFPEPVTDAGQLTDTATRTFGNGPLTRISGSLNGDTDVDMYRIIIDDPSVFSASTVPDPGSGFSGAAFDTVLTLINSPGFGTRGFLKADNVSASIPQSSMTAPSAVAGREYYLCISTPKSRPLSRVWNYSTNTFPLADIWSPDPSGLAVGGGLVYYPDPSLGRIERRTTVGDAQPPLSAPAITSHIALDSAGGKIYWADRGNGTSSMIRRSNLDGSAEEQVVTGASALTAFNVTGLALDTVNGKVYWSRSILGEINRCNVDGTGHERVIQDYPPTDGLFPTVPGGLPVGNFAPNALAVDPVGGRIYLVNTFVNRIQRANLNGTGRVSLPVGADAAQIALDIPAGKIYWTNTIGNKIQSANLDGSGLVDVLSTPSPVALALDTAAGLIYWSNTIDRTIHRATLVGASPVTFATVEVETGQHTPDGYGAAFTFDQWVPTGLASPGSLPYQIRLTGATYNHEAAMIAKGASKVVAVGDVTPGTAPHSITSIGDADAAIRISDRGDVLWTGRFFQPTPFINYLFDALFWNGERLLTSMDIPTGTNLDAQKLINFYRTPYSLDMSDNGEWAMIAVNMQVPNYNFTPQPDNALLFQFTLPAQCPGDFNQSGSITVQDIFDFLAAYFSSSPSADVNNSGTVTVQDIFDFLSFYFAGCP